MHKGTQSTYAMGKTAVIVQLVEAKVTPPAKHTQSRDITPPEKKMVLWVGVGN